MEKDFSKIIKTERYRHIFWANVCYQFSIGNTSKLIAFAPKIFDQIDSEDDVWFIVPDERAITNLNLGETGYFFRMRGNYPKGITNCLHIAVIFNEEYELYKKGEILIQDVRLEDGIEVTAEDIPFAYKILGD